MIGYFTKAGDVEVGAIFDPYRQSFKRLLKQRFEGRKYGDGLDLILIEYHLEGKHLQLPDNLYKVMPYRKKEHALSVIVGVSQNFGKMLEVEKRQFIIDTTLDAVKLVQEKMLRLGFHDIDFAQLFNDITECAKEYLQLSTINIPPRV